MGKLPPALAKYEAGKKAKSASKGKAKPAAKPAFLMKKKGK